MSSGHITRGSMSSANYYDKVWSGTNGRKNRNPYGCTIVELKDPVSISITYVANNTLAQLGSQSFPYTTKPLGVPAITGVELLLANKLLGKVGAFEFNPGVSAVEAKETSSMLKDVPRKVKSSALAVYKSAMYVRKGRFKKAFSTLRLANTKAGRSTSKWRFDPFLFQRIRKVRTVNGDWISAAWLEFRYGWQPLLSDIHSALKWIDNECKKQNATVVRFVCRKAALASDTPLYISGSWRYTVNRVSKRKEQLIAYVMRENSLSESIDWAMLDPSVLAWELLPFSFMADWFIDFGSWLTAQAALRKLKAVYVRTTTTHQIVANLVIDTRYVPSGVKKINQNVDRYYYEKTVVNRSISSNFSIPLPSWHLPFKNELKHLTDAFAIFHQLRISR